MAAGVDPPDGPSTMAAAIGRIARPGAAAKPRCRRPSSSRDRRPRPPGLLLQHALSSSTSSRSAGRLRQHALDLAHGVQHRGVVAAAEAPADLGQRARRQHLGEYIAIWRGLTMAAVRRDGQDVGAATRCSGVATSFWMSSMRTRLRLAGARRDRGSRSRPISTRHRRAGRAWHGRPAGSPRLRGRGRWSDHRGRRSRRPPG